MFKHANIENMTDKILIDNAQIGGQAAFTNNNLNNDNILVIIEITEIGSLSLIIIGLQFDD